MLTRTSAARAAGLSDDQCKDALPRDEFDAAVEGDEALEVFSYLLARW